MKNLNMKSQQMILVKTDDVCAVSISHFTWVESSTN